MTAARRPQPEQVEKQILLASFGVALLVECCALVAPGLMHLGVGDGTPASQSMQNNWVETQIYELPEQPRLVEQRQAPTPAAAVKEISINPKATQKLSAENAAARLDQENVTENSPPIPRDHGPVPIYQPKPVLPTYLEYQDAAQSVVVVFEVFATGEAHPRLVVSSGQQEIDAVVLETLRKWKFRPAERDGKAIDSRFRTRVEVVPS